MAGLWDINCSSCGKKISIMNNPNYCPYCAQMIPNRKPTIHKPDTVYSNGKIKYFYDDVKIFVSDNAARMCIAGSQVYLEHEEGNEYDPNAIAVMSKYERKLGYLYKNKLQEMVHDFQKRGEDIIARVVFNDIEKNELIISLAFYKRLTDGDIIKTFTVSVSESKYDELFCAELNEEVSIAYDYEKEKYMIEDWATFPKRLEEYADDESYAFIVLDDEEKDNGNHSIKIGILERR